MHAPKALLEGAPAAVGSRELTVPAEDGRELAATLFEPATPAVAHAPFAVVAPGAAVKRRYYARFAAYLAERGHPTLTFDYRDIGGSRQGSLAGSKVRMRDWCTRDVPGVLAWAARTYPEQPIHWLGHSMGGFATGLAHNNRLVARQLNIATLSGYWRRMSAPERYRVRVLMRLVGPPAVRLMGYFPGVLMGGEDMPGPAYMEWMGRCMDPEFLFGDATLSERRHVAELRAAIRFVQISDDIWGTEAAVGHMARQFTGSADCTLWRVTPADAGVKAIGHFGFFRPELRETLWKQAADWLLAP
jgi:predicted alpha/beta hydrolase